MQEEENKTVNSSDIENKAKKNNKAKCWFFEKIIKIDKPPVRSQ